MSAPKSPESEYSLISSLDAMSLSTDSGSRRVSSDSGRSTSSYEEILVPSVASLEGSSIDRLAQGEFSAAPGHLSRVATPKARRVSSTATDSSEQIVDSRRPAVGASSARAKTRRSGRKQKRRQGAVGGPTLEEVKAAVGARVWDESSEDGASLLLDDEDDSVSGSERRVNSMLGSGSRTTDSVMSMEDAVSSINSFLAETDDFVAGEGSKLRLWQSLCIELGVAKPLGASATPASRSSSRSATPTGSRCATPTAGDRAPTPTPGLPDVPQSLNKCKALLDNVHVNLVDYLERRDLVSAGAADGYKDLHFASLSAVRRYTLKNRKFAQLDLVKGDWLTPLLFSVRPGR